MQRLTRLRLIGKYAPLLVYFNVTDRCNKKCRYCSNVYYERGTKDLPKETIFDIVNQFADLGTVRFTLAGGEPLCRDDIDEIIDCIKARNMECVMISNGELIPEKIETIKKLDTLCLSFDGKKENHDYYRGEGSHDEVIRAFGLAKDLGINLYCSTVVSDRNIDSIEYVFERAKEFGFLPGFAVMKDSKDEVIGRPSEDTFRNLVKKLINYKKKGMPMLHPTKVYELLLEWTDFDEELIFDKAPRGLRHVQCRSGRYSACIDTGGDLYPCIGSVGKLKNMPNCAEIGVRKAFEIVNKHNCVACFNPIQIHHNLIFALEGSSLFDAAKQSMEL